MLSPTLLQLLLWSSFLGRAKTTFYVHHSEYDPLTNKFDCIVIDGQFIDVEYCRRPSVHSESLITGHCLSSKVTFDTLRDHNVTAKDLFKAFAPVDLIDKYQTFIDNPTENSINENSYFCNCSHPTQLMFGKNCEYTFAVPLSSGDILNFEVTSRIELVRRTLSRYRLQTFDEQYLVTHGTCYTNLPGCRTISNICMHWNQVCNGKDQS